MSFSRAFQWYHSHLDPIWPDSTFNHAQHYKYKDDTSHYLQFSCKGKSATQSNNILVYCTNMSDLPSNIDTLRKYISLHWRLEKLIYSTYCIGPKSTSPNTYCSGRETIIYQWIDTFSYTISRVHHSYICPPSKKIKKLLINKKSLMGTWGTIVHCRHVYTNCDTNAGILKYLYAAINNLKRCVAVLVWKDGGENKK